MGNCAHSFPFSKIMNTVDAWYLIFALYGMLSAWAMIEGLK